jgi:alanyl-tRNA synthetase
MLEQKERSRAAASKESDDWVELVPESDETEFVGYDTLETTTEILRYRRVKTAKREFYQIVLGQTPFYAESGGQVGDKGYLEANGHKIEIEDTRKENNLIVHIVAQLPADPALTFRAVVDSEKRQSTANNHSATHLMHAALRQVLGSHVEQKGSLVDDEKLRFDFSHFAKLSDEEIKQVEDIVNKKIRENIKLTEARSMPVEQAREMGAMALFGEKYGDFVRVISFDPAYSVELCGGTHVQATGQIGLFKVISESAIAAGVRRIEGITAGTALQFLNQHILLIEEIKGLVKNPVDVIKGVKNLIDENKRIEEEVDKLKKEKVASMKDVFVKSLIQKEGFQLLITKIDADAASIKDLAFIIKAEVPSVVLLFAYVNEGKPGISLLIGDQVQTQKSWNAGQIVRELAKEIQGGGGGQPGFATAGGSKPEGIQAVIDKARILFN